MARSTRPAGPQQLSTEQLQELHAGLYRFSRSFDGDRYQEIWNGLDEEVREQIKAKARWEHVTLSGAMAGWWPELYRPAANFCLYDQEGKLAGYVYSDGTVRKRLKGWQRAAYPVTLETGDYWVEWAGEEHLPLGEAYARREELGPKPELASLSEELQAVPPASAELDPAALSVDD